MCFCAYYYSIILASNMYSECVSVHRIARGTNCVLENEFYGNFYHRFTFLNHIVISYKNWLVFYIEHYEKKGSSAHLVPKQIHIIFRSPFRMAIS